MNGEDLIAVSNYLFLIDYLFLLHIHHRFGTLGDDNYFVF